MLPPSRPVVSSAREWIGVGLLFALLTAIVTWPQPAVWLTHAHAHHDSLFSMWRLSWIAEALATQPSRLFDAPIFHPATRTLAFSDAVFLQGLVATPLLAAGAPVLPVYNVLLLLGPWCSALGTYLLVRDLLARSGKGTAAFWPAVVAGAIFGLLPYRVDHLMHLELQWSQWMPLACWALHRTIWHGRLRDGVLTTVFVLAQFLSCIYYGVFLVLALGIATPLLLIVRDRAPLGRIARAFALGAVVCAAPLVAYSAPYRENQARLGGRAAWEIDTWSATGGSFVSAPVENRLYGAALHRNSIPEGRLWPGVTAIALGLAGVWAWRRAREAQFYLLVLVVSAVLAMGTHTPVYRLALAVAPPLRGLRAPARFGMIAALALGVLASLGAAWLLTRIERGARRHAVGAALVALLMIEYASNITPLHPWTQRAPVYAQWLRAQPPGVVVDLPLPRADQLPGHEAEWSFYARFHGQPIVNGYSGYFPARFIDMLPAMQRFPDAASLRVLRGLDVRYIVVHEDRYDAGDVLEIDTRLRGLRGVHPVGRIPDPAYPVLIYTLE
jgi:hypothetical protein